MRYEQEYVELHQKHPDIFTGRSTYEHKDRIANLIELTGSSTVLDYGCGKGKQYTIDQYDLYWGVEVDCYDPAVDIYKTLPDKKYDGVIAIYVMEHIPEEEVDEVLEKIFSRAEKFVYLAIDDFEGRRTFSDGVTKIHVCLRSQEWWDDKVRQHNKNNVFVAGKLVSDYPHKLKLSGFNY